MSSWTISMQWNHSKSTVIKPFRKKTPFGILLKKVYQGDVRGKHISSSDIQDKSLINVLRDTFFVTT